MPDSFDRLSASLKAIRRQLDVLLALEAVALVLTAVLVYAVFVLHKPL